MRVTFSERFTRSFADAPEQVQRSFGKQFGHLLRNLRHPSLQAKKYDAQRDVWQARADLNWRFYFTIEGDTCHMIDIGPHPK
jgi:hypothetical protein